MLISIYVAISIIGVVFIYANKNTASYNNYVNNVSKYFILFDFNYTIDDIRNYYGTKNIYLTHGIIVLFIIVTIITNVVFIIWNINIFLYRLFMALVVIGNKAVR